MWKFPPILIALLLVTITCAAQDTSNSNKIRQSKKRWTLNGEKLNNTELKNLLTKYPESNQHLKKSKTSTILSCVFAAAGAGFIFIPKTPSHGGIENGYDVAAVACLGASFYFTFKARKDQKRAVEAYNNLVY